jgi:ribonuclease R
MLKFILELNFKDSLINFMVKSSKKSKKKEFSFRPSKEEKLFNNLLKITEQFMSGKGFMPLTFHELIQRLSLPPQHQDIFKNVLQHLIEANLIEFTQERYAWKLSRMDVMTGTIKMHPRGFGFVQPDNPALYIQDIFIPKHLTKNAVDGDVVEVLINQESISDKGPEGKVLAILSRARTHMAGIIRQVDQEGWFIAHIPLLGTQQRVIVEPTEEHPLRIGDRIVMEVTDWGSKETETVCRFSHYLGHISDPSCDIYAAIEEFELRADFPSRVIEEAQALGKQVSRKDMQEREDLRHLTTLTIDPDTAKDFDDALSLTKDEYGFYHLGVHIADVSHYVRPGTALDEEARQRCNSTYFPAVCLPMLPSALSENLCSLKPNVNRLTVSVLMRFDPQGTLVDHRMTRSIIKSSKRFTYKEAKKVLDGEIQSPHLSNLALMVELCRLLKRKRYERGSIEFSLPELVVLVDEKGTPYQTDYITYDITHQMVEEFMLKANEMVAWDLTERGKNLTYRVHDVPAEENLRDFSLLAAAFGFRIPDNPNPQDLQKLFEEAGETPYGNYLASSYIRRMRLAAYSAENIGHYGLSLTHYCHFTSPIRRYVDLVVHRILFGESDDLEYLRQVANQCSEQERISAKAESSVVLLKKLRLLHEMHVKDPYREYEAIITRVKNFGIYFEIIELLLEGFIHISELEEDYFVFEEEKMRLRGTRGGNFYAPGDRLTVILKSVDFVFQETKWYTVSNQHSVLTPETKKQHKKSSRPSSGKRLLAKWTHKKAKKKSSASDKKKRKKV